MKNSMKKAVSILLIALFIMSFMPLYIHAFIKYNHIYSGEWKTSDMAHWLECEECGEIGYYNYHIYDNDCDDTCNVCGYVRQNIKHTYSTVWSSDGTSHWHECIFCGTKTDVTDHVPGAEATETTPQKCTVCGYILKSALGHTHTFGTEWKIDKTSHWHECKAKDGAISDKEEHQFGEWENIKEPTSFENGSKDRTCTVCGYSEKEIIEPISYKMTSGDMGYWTPQKSSGLSFRTEADAKEFVNVMVDGKVVDASYYTVSEGLTVVDFKEDFFRSLNDGKHNLVIAYNHGSAKTSFTISGNDEMTNPTEDPQEKSTGCGSFIGFGGLFVIVSASAGALAICKKKKQK